MKSRDTASRDSAEFRRSWIYWANVHEHFGGDCRPGSPPRPVPPNNPSYQGVSNFTPQSPIEEATWCECEHGLPHFLTWHRMYLYYFEQVLRDAAGDPNLQLPYWNFERDRPLPQIVRDETYVDAEGVTRPNPLFVRARRRTLAAGEPLGPEFVDTADAFRQRDFLSFSEILSSQPHGNVHCAIGMTGCPSGLMGNTRSAGLDPVFYLHHANIDRLYECWLGPTPGPRLPSDAATLDQRYSFIDGAGAVQNRSVREMLRASQLSYAYSRPERCPPARRGTGPGFLSAPNARTYTIGGGATLERGVTRVPLAISSETRSSLRTSQFLSAQSTQTVLVIRDIEFDAPPQTLYEVYLSGPSNRRIHAGIINFFNVGTGHEGHGDGENGRLDATLDISDSIRSISPSGDLPAGTTLEFVPSTGVSGATVEEALQDVPADANVRYGSVQLIVIPE